MEIVKIGEWLMDHGSDRAFESNGWTVRWTPLNTTARCRLQGIESAARETGIARLKQTLTETYRPYS